VTEPHGPTHVHPADGRPPVRFESEVAADRVAPGARWFLADVPGPRLRLRDGAGTPIASLEGHRNDVLGWAFGPRGDFVATASADKTGRRWDTSGVERARLRGHPRAVTGIAFDPAEDLLATVSEDGAARLWSARGLPRDILPPPDEPLGRPAPLRSVFFTRDGSRVVGRLAPAGEPGAGTDAGALVWRIRAADLLECADRCLSREFTEEERDEFRDLLEPAGQ
jgi:hypothetical protein